MGKKKKEVKMVRSHISESMFETMMYAFNHAEDYEDSSVDDRYFNFEVDIENGDIKEMYLHSDCTTHNAEKINI